MHLTFERSLHNSLNKATMILLLVTLTGVQPGQSGSMTITFQVWDFQTAEPLPSSIVLLTGGAVLNQTTNEAGNTTITLPFGSYTITVSKSQCSKIGPQPFTVDETTPSFVIAKLQCPSVGSPPFVNPHVQTDKSEYQIGQVISWTTTGFAPGAYVQPCIGDLCGGVVQSNRSGIAQGTFAVDARVNAGNQTLTATDITSDASAQIQILVLV